MVHTDVCGRCVRMPIVRMPIDFELVIIQVLNATIHVLNVFFPVSIHVLVLHVCIRIWSGYD